MSNPRSQLRSDRRFNLFMAVSGTLIPLVYGAWYTAKNKKPPTPVHIVKEAFSTPVGVMLTLDLLLCYILFLKQAHQEVKTGKAKGPFGLYAFLSTFCAISSAWPVMLLRRKKV